VTVLVRSTPGREAVVAVLGQGDFLGEGCLAGQSRRTTSARAIAPSAINVIEATEMVRLIHEQHALADRFISHILARNIHVDEDLIDQLVDSIETRLARAVLLRRATARRTGPTGCSRASRSLISPLPAPCREVGRL